MEIAFSLLRCHPEHTRDLTQAHGSHRLAYTRSSSGCLADIPQRLFVHIQNRSVRGKRSDRGDVAAACAHRRSQTAATDRKLTARRFKVFDVVTFRPFNPLTY